MIHRDLKPANLMVVSIGTQQEHFKVMDFGLAHLSSKPYLSRERLSGATMVEVTERLLISPPSNYAATTWMAAQTSIARALCCSRP